MTKKIIVQQLSEKSGTSAKGKAYTKYGICDQDNVWYNSFQRINAAEGNEYMIDFKTGDYGNDLIDIKPVAEETHKVNGENRQNSIIRQHSQHMAVLWAQGHQVADLEALKIIIDWFDTDAKETEAPF